MRLQSRVCTASVAFAVRFAARLSLCDLTTRQASLHATDRPVAPPVGLLTLGFDAGRFPPTPPVCYRASWQLPGPDLHRQAMTSLRSKDQLQHQPHLRSTGRTVGSSAGAVATERLAGSRPGHRGGVSQHTGPGPADGQPGSPRFQRPPPRTGRAVLPHPAHRRRSPPAFGFPRQSR